MTRVPRRGVALLLVLLGLALVRWQAPRAQPGAAPGTPTTLAGATATRPGEPAADRRSGRRPARWQRPTGALRLEGLVVDADDQPVGGAHVVLAGAEATTTEADGSFAFDDLAAGDYDVTAELDGAFDDEEEVSLDATSEPVMLRLVRGPTLRVHVVTVDGAPIAGADVDTSSRHARTDAAGRATLRAVDAVQDRVRVTAPRFATTRVEVLTGDDDRATIDAEIVVGPGASLAGVVLDEDGRPVADASVELESTDAMPGDYATTDAAGAWELTDVGAGARVLSASSATLLSAGPVTLDLDGRAPRGGVVLRVARGARITGVVLDERGAPVEGARVDVGNATATTDARGAFEQRGLAADTYQVVATTDTAASAPSVVVLAARGEASVALTVRPSGIAGVIVDEAGAPVADAHVRAFIEGDGPGLGLATTDEHGRFDIGGVPPGMYEVSANRDDADDVSASTRVAAGVRSVRLVLPSPAQLRGRVLQDGRPVAYLGVILAPDTTAAESADPVVVRDRDGRFLLRALPPGRHVVVLVGPSFERQELAAVQLAPGAVLDLGDIEVHAGRVVRGRVVDERGAPVAGARVRLGDPSPRWGRAPIENIASGEREVLTDAGGAFELAGLTSPDGPLPLTATHPTRGAARPTRLPPDAREIELVLVGVGGIDGLDRGPHDEGWSNAYLHPATAAEDDDASVALDVPVDDEGRFRFDHVPVGDYTIEVVSVREGRTSVRAEVTVVAGQRARVEIPAPAP